MLNPDFSERTYTAEVLRTESNSADIMQTLKGLVRGPKTQEEFEDNSEIIKIVHGFCPASKGYHSLTRTKTIQDNNGKEIEIEIPRREDSVRGRSLYDVLIAQCQRHIIVAVPFHKMAAEFFPKVDKSLEGTGTVYERLDITKMVMFLGSKGMAEISVSNRTAALSLTRCHLAYSNRDMLSGNLKQIQMTGANLGLTDEYKGLVAPVLKTKQNDSGICITPIVLGFALSENGIKKSSAITDKHGNFKIWVAPGVKRLIRIFGLLRAIEEIENIVSTTSNVPILQSMAIEGAED